MKADRFTLLEQNSEHILTAEVSDRVYLNSGDIRDSMGWEVKERGLCKDDTCVPIPNDVDLMTERGIDLETFAELLDRPLTIERDERVAYLGLPFQAVEDTINSGIAPDFTLPSWTQEAEYSLSDFEGNKIFLLVWASW